MDYISFCRNYFSLTNIPINLLKKGNVVYSAIGEMLPIPYQTYWDIFPSEYNPSFCRLSPDIEYGRIQIEKSDYDLIIGPAFNIPVTEEIVRSVIHELAIPFDYWEQLSEFLHSIPRTSPLQFFKHLSFIHLCINGKESDYFDFYQQEDLQEREQQHLAHIVEDRENESLHNTYYFEMGLFQYIRDGNVDKLQSFLLSAPSDLKEGKMAKTPLRQAKNLFISVATKAGMIGAIPGGVDVEETYQLIDLYIQECEQLQSIKEISALQYAMIMDFCQRAGETKIPEGISSDVYVCINFIRNHTNEPITVQDVASQILRSTSYIRKRFKAELGININAFIIRCKLEEAKSLLTHSDKSLVEISNYLCFSSQSYFQNLFKKQYKVTPMQYRKDGRRL